MSADRSLLVIGGSGFFGKSILDAFRRGRLAPWSIGRITIIARNAHRLRCEHPGLINEAVAVLDLDLGLATALPAADFVIHAASSTDARLYAHSPASERANILRAVDRYCDIARVDHRASRILYTSSGAVYGQQPSAVGTIDERFEPGDTDNLVSYKRDYAQAKRLAEQRIHELGQDGLRVTVARCFTFVGPYLPHDQHFAIGNFLADGLAGRPIRVAARHPVYRSYMHADDLVVWLMSMVAAADTTCPIYNVGSDQALVLGDVALAVARSFGVVAEIPSFIERAPDMYIPSIAKARSALGLDLTHDLESALIDVITRLRSDRLKA